MGIFNFLSDIFTPVSKTIDDLHFSGEEKGNIDIKKSELQNKLAEIEAKVATKMLDLQSQAILANSRVAMAEQEHGNWLSKSHRPLTSLLMVGIIIGMSFEFIPYNDLIIKIAGAFLGVYGVGRSVEKIKK